MSGEKATSSLEQFITLSKTARGAAAVSLIKQALETPNLYVFGELLDGPSIKQLEESAQHKPYFELLKLFAYGTCNDYAANKQAYPELSLIMVKKLRHLTLASLASQSKHIPYSLLLQQLDLHNVRELEDLIIEAIYCGIIKARLDQQKQTLEIQYALGRDVEISKIPELLGILNDWMDTCSSTLNDIQTQIVEAQTQKTNQSKQKRQTDEEIANIKKTLKVSGSNERQAGSRYTSEVMDTETKAVKKQSKTKGLRGSNMKLFKSGGN